MKLSVNYWEQCYTGVPMLLTTVAVCYVCMKEVSMPLSNKCACGVLLCEREQCGRQTHRRACDDVRYVIASQQK